MTVDDGRTRASLRGLLARVLSLLGLRVSHVDSAARSRASSVLLRRAALLAGRTSRDFPLHLSNLGVAYQQLDRQGSPGALTRAIAAHSTALTRLDSKHEAYATVASNLASALLERHERYDTPLDLERSLHLLRKALADTPGRHPDRAAIAYNTAAALSFRLDKGDIASGREAVALCSEASGWLVPHDPLAADLETLRGQLLHGISEQTGSRIEGDAAVKALETALETTTRRGDVPHARTALARALRLRADRYGRLDDLTRAIEHIDRALAETPATAVRLRHLRLGMMALARVTHFQWTKAPTDLDDAITAFEHLSVDDPHRAATHRANLAVCLVERSATGATQSPDLDRAIDIFRELIASPAQANAEIWRALADALLDRATDSDSDGDWAEARQAAEAAVRVSGLDHPALSRCLSTLGEVHLDRYLESG